MADASMQRPLWITNSIDNVFYKTSSQTFITLANKKLALNFVDLFLLVEC